jgi:hypothetical protein
MDSSDNREPAATPTLEQNGILENVEPKSPQLKAKQPRSEAQVAALARARSRAMVVRQESIARKEEQFKSEQAYFRKESEKDEPTEEDKQWIENEWRKEERDAERASPNPPNPKRRKPARRVIVTEVSSASDEDSDVEIVLPRVAKQKPLTDDQLKYKAAESKMFSY